MKNHSNQQLVKKFLSTLTAFKNRLGVPIIVIAEILGCISCYACVTRDIRLFFIVLLLTVGMSEIYTVIKRRLSAHSNDYTQYLSPVYWKTWSLFVLDFYCFVAQEYLTIGILIPTSRASAPTWLIVIAFFAFIAGGLLRLIGAWCRFNPILQSEEESAQEKFQNHESLTRPGAGKFTN